MKHPRQNGDSILQLSEAAEPVNGQAAYPTQFTFKVLKNSGPRFMTFVEQKQYTIETGQSSQYIYVWEGDSGGAVFRTPTSTGTIIALGIAVAAEKYDPNGIPGDYDDQACTSDTESLGDTGDCWMIHMPIDYIDDHQLLTVETAAP
jgi:hypothetical protein